MADITLQITIPEEHQQRVIDAFTLASGKELEISAHHPLFDGRWSFSVAPKLSIETMKEFGERFFKELGISVIRLVALYLDQQRYETEIGAIQKPEQNVPDDILE